MATLEEQEKERKRLDTALAQLAQISPESLVRADALGGELSFEKGPPFFQRTLRVFRDLQACSLDGASHQARHQRVNTADAAVTAFKKVQGFTIAQYPQNAIQMRDQFINEIRDAYDSQYQVVTPHIAYAVRKGTDFEALESEARTTLGKVRANQTEQLSSQKALLDESGRIVESMRRAAAEVGVAQHAIYFKREADEHTRRRKAVDRNHYARCRNSALWRFRRLVLLDTRA